MVSDVFVPLQKIEKKPKTSHGHIRSGGKGKSKSTLRPRAEEGMRRDGSIRTCVT